MTKPAPMTVSVKAGSPATALSGMRFVTEGVIVMVRALEVRFVGAGFNTETEAVPTVAVSVPEIDAVSLVEFTKVVDLLVPFHRTFAPLTKPTPSNVKVKPLPPTLAVDGERLVINGFTVRLLDVDVPPPGAGLKTVTANTPALAMSDAESKAVN